MTSTELARDLVDRLVAAGVEHLVLCPGSRSAPLAFASYDAAEAGRITLHTRIDERTAGFLALGLAKGSHRPAVVVCTSGTAAANLHPAALEAAHAGVPLVVVTADRPASMRGTGANQTTDQVGLFGEAAATLDVASADDLVGVVVGEGPVHVNVQFVEPLVPGVGRIPPTSPPAPAPSWSPGTMRAHRHASSPRTPAGLCSPSRPAGRARGTARSAPTGSCSAVTSPAGSSESSSSGTRRSRDR